MTYLNFIPARCIARVFLIFAILINITSCRDENGVRETQFTMVTTLAGSDGPGFVDGIGALSKFNYPCGIVVDTQGNLYVSDHSNHSIRKVTPRGIVSTFAGTGQAGATDGPRL